MTHPTTLPTRVLAAPRPPHTRARLAAAVTAPILIAALASHARAQAPLDFTAKSESAIASAAATRPSFAPAMADSARSNARVAQPGIAARHLDASVALRGGTLGAGIEVGKLITDHLAVRAGYFHTPLSMNQTISGVRYDAQVQLQGGELLADLFPSSRGRFHVTAGAIVNGPRITGSALPGADGTITLNGHPYSQAEFGRLSGTLSVRSVAPYLGLGFGTPARRSAVSLVTDVGVMLGGPTLALDATGAAGNAALRSDLAAQQAKTQHDISRYGRVVPVSSIGLAVRF